MQIKPAANIRGETRVPGDKSISHRALLLGAVAEGETVLRGACPGRDCLSTADCLSRLGVSVRWDGETVAVQGVGLHGLKQPDGPLDAGNSATTARLLLGLLAGQDFDSVLTGDASLQRRPMGRVISPLSLMGASIAAEENECLPARVRGRMLTGIHYTLPVASAQVKSAVLLAGLGAEGVTTVAEPVPTRDHTERMLRQFGAQVLCGKGCPPVFRLAGGYPLRGCEVEVPGDFSAAAFLLTAALLLPDSEIRLRDVGINPTRTGLLDVLRRMGGNLSADPTGSGWEPVADLTARSSKLRGVTVSGAEIPRLIDELPVLCCAAALAEGETVIRDAQELRLKETDRIAAVCGEFSKAGVGIRETPDGLVIRGGAAIAPARFQARGDHRIAMACAVLGLCASGDSWVEDAETADVSFPGFFPLLQCLTKQG